MLVSSVQGYQELCLRKSPKRAGRKHLKSNHCPVLSRSGRTHDSLPRFLDKKCSASVCKPHPAAEASAGNRTRIQFLRRPENHRRLHLGRGCFFARVDFLQHACHTWVLGLSAWFQNGTEGWREYPALRYSCELSLILHAHGNRHREKPWFQPDLKHPANNLGSVPGCDGDQLQISLADL